MFPIVLAQDAPTARDLEELRRLTEASWAPRPYVSSLPEGGPLYIGLHLLMLVAAIVAVVLTVRDPRSLSAWFFSLLPFAFGATAMWLHVLGLTAVTKAVGGYEGNLAQQLSELPRPFYLGCAMSAVLLLIVMVLRRIRTSPNVA